MDAHCGSLCLCRKRLFTRTDLFLAAFLACSPLLMPPGSFVAAPAQGGDALGSPETITEQLPCGFRASVEPHLFRGTVGRDSQLKTLSRPTGGGPRAALLTARLSLPASAATSCWLPIMRPNSTGCRERALRRAGLPRLRLPLSQAVPAFGGSSAEGLPHETTADFICAVVAWAPRDAGSMSRTLQNPGVEGRHSLIYWDICGLPRPWRRAPPCMGGTIPQYPPTQRPS